MIRPVLASDFGNLWAMITLLPIAAVSLLAAFVCLLLKRRAACRILGAVAVLFSGMFLLTIGDAREFDQGFTFVCSLIGIGAGLFFVRSGSSSEINGE